MLNSAFERLHELIVANLVEFLGHQEAQNFLERNELVQPTMEDVSEKENWRHMNPLSTVLRALAIERVPLTNPAVVYKAFRTGWLEEETPAETVERIRLEPAVRGSLWGNHTSYQHVLLPASFDVWMESRSELIEDLPILVISRAEATQVLDAIEAALSLFSQPALVIRGQVYRALTRALISSRLPAVPVLSFQERSAVDSLMTEMILGSVTPMGQAE